ncbi:DUF3139 domain-containing protein [Solibacillus sp. FSL W7-1324]|uniref:DUF3139 domain-containing protein n=1 Tax=Solibacillus sp. FSL W7-1324 TaxID=2921701 RepID=UPI0030F708A8
MPKKFKIVLLFLIFVLGIILARFIYIKANEHIYANRVTDYLVNEMEYDEGEIASVEGVYGFKLPKFYVVVTFTNEPHIEYVYFAHERVLQFEYQIIDKAFEGITKEDLHNYDPNGSIN